MGEGAKEVGVMESGWYQRVRKATGGTAVNGQQGKDAKGFGSSDDDVCEAFFSNGSVKADNYCGTREKANVTKRRVECI